MIGVRAWMQVVLLHFFNVERGLFRYLIGLLTKLFMKFVAETELFI